MQAAETIQEFLKDVGILENLNSDRTPFLCQRESSYLNLAKGKRINLNYADPEYSNGIYNVGIKIIDLKKCWHHNMVSNNCPRRVWYFVLKHAANVIHMIPSAKLNGITPIEAVTGETPDILVCVDFDLYDLVW